MRTTLRSRVRPAAALVASWALAFATATAWLSRPEMAQASVAVSVTWNDLVARSSVAALATPSEAMSVWEDGRIWTYTRVNVDRSVAGELPTGASAWIRTRGGVVGKIGQQVEGEALFTRGRQALVFLTHGPAGSFEVTERGQGQFAIESTAEAGPAPRILRGRSLGVILAPKLPSATSASAPLADDVLRGRTVEDAVRAIASDWDRLHGR